MKNVKNESLKSIVGAYMKKRQYCDNENVRKFEMQLSKTAESSAISGLVELEASCPNSISYKCVNNDPVIAEAQFANLKTWITEMECSKTSEELKNFLFPMLCHIYLDMLIGGHKAAASSFLMKHQSVGLEEGYDLLEELATVEDLKDLAEKKILNNLRTSKFQVTLSPKSIHVLKQYLAKKAHVIVLQIVNSWFDVEEAKSSNEPIFDLVDDSSASQAANTNGVDETPSILHLDNDIAKIEEIIRNVVEGPYSSPPMALYSVSNPSDSMTCGVINSQFEPMLACGYTTSEIRVWSLTDQKLQKPNPCLQPHIRLAIDDDDAEVAGQYSHKSFRYNRDAYVPTPDNLMRVEDSVELIGHYGAVQDICFIKGSHYLLSVSVDKTMRAWDLENFSNVSVYRGHLYPIWCIDASPHAGFAATGSYDTTARLWSLDLNFPLRIFAGHLEDVNCLRFHPNGSYLATGSSDSTVRLWSVDSGELVRVFEGHRGSIMSIAFSPDGNQLATGGDDKRLRVWDLRNCNVVGEFRGHEGTILTMDWSPNGNLLASCGADKTARFWPVKNLTADGEQLDVKTCHFVCNAMGSMQFSPTSNPQCVIGVK